MWRRLVAGLQRLHITFKRTQALVQPLGLAHQGVDFGPLSGNGIAHLVELLILVGDQRLKIVDALAEIRLICHHVSRFVGIWPKVSARFPPIHFNLYSANTTGENIASPFKTKNEQFMNAKNLSILAIVLWLAGAATVGSMFISGNTEEGGDGREAVLLSASERDFILAEMRKMLEAVRGIVAASADDDMKSVAEIALAIGSAEVRNVPKSLMLKLPRDFKVLGTDNHLEFDQVAAEAKKGSKAVLRRLSDLMLNCVGCHESYSLKAE